MTTGDAPGTWYVRARGRVLGPLTRVQLQSLRDRGQLARFDQVSQDRQTWIGADRLDGLFAQSGGEGSLISTTASDGIADFIVLDDNDAGPGPARNADAPEWFFARGGAHQGPVSLSDLQGMADRGEIEPETLVWRGGMEQWTPGSWVSELRFSGPLPAAQGNSGANITPASGVALPPGQKNHSAGQPILATRTSVLAISSLVMGLFWMFGLGSLAAIVLGAMSLRQIGRSNGTLAGKRLAIAGMIAGILGLVISVLTFLLAARSSGGS